MASRFLPSRNVGLALVAGCLVFSTLAAANLRPEELSVSEIEEQLQVREFAGPYSKSRALML